MLILNYFDHFKSFWAGFYNFFQKCFLAQSWDFFALYLVHQNPSFELPKSDHFTIFSP